MKTMIISLNFKFISTVLSLESYCEHLDQEMLLYLAKIPIIWRKAQKLSNLGASFFSSFSLLSQSLANIAWMTEELIDLILQKVWRYICWCWLYKKLSIYFFRVSIKYWARVPLESLNNQNVSTAWTGTSLRVMIWLNFWSSKDHSFSSKHLQCEKVGADLKVFWMMPNETSR